MKITKIKDVKTPERGTTTAAGIDFFIPNDFTKSSITLNPNSGIIIPSGIIAEVPKGYMLCAHNKSSIGAKGIIVGASVVDEDYQGEIHINIHNISNSPFTLYSGQKIIQFILIPVNYEPIEVVNKSELFIGRNSSRGEGGFGSTTTFEFEKITAYITERGRVIPSKHGGACSLWKFKDIKTNSIYELWVDPSMKNFIKFKEGDVLTNLSLKAVNSKTYLDSKSQVKFIGKKDEVLNYLQNEKLKKQQQQGFTI